MVAVICTMSIFFNACSDEQEVGISTQGGDKAAILKQAESIDAASYAGLEDVFLDTKTLTLGTDKITVFIFAKNNCFYCEKLKTDIMQNTALKSMLQTHFLPYYINTSYTKKHILTAADIADSQVDSAHAQKQRELTTMSLMELYVTSAMRPTPTFVFVDSKGDSIYELPGYLPSERIIRLLEYMTSGDWEGKSKAQIAERVNEELL